jgi:hypothetical protein
MTLREALRAYGVEVGRVSNFSSMTMVKVIAVQIVGLVLGTGVT